MITLLNRVAEDTGSLDMTLLKFAALLLAEAQGAQTSRAQIAAFVEKQIIARQHAPVYRVGPSRGRA